MLQFDLRGNLKPHKPIQCGLKDLKRHFVDEIESDSRLDNYKKYLRYSNNLKTLLGNRKLKQWLNGSFVTKKRNPKDIDLVTFIDNNTIELFGDRLNTFRGVEGWEVYKVDAYIIPVHSPQSKLVNFTELDTTEWLYLFGHTKLNRKGQVFGKGFLEIFY